MHYPRQKESRARDLTRWNLAASLLIEVRGLFELWEKVVLPMASGRARISLQSAGRNLKGIPNHYQNLPMPTDVRGTIVDGDCLTLAGWHGPGTESAGKCILRLYDSEGLQALVVVLLLRFALCGGWYGNPRNRAAFQPRKEENSSGLNSWGAPSYLRGVEDHLHRGVTNVAVPVVLARGVV